jgi:hypothetical protein
MTPIQPTGFHYFSWKPTNSCPTDLKHLFYASWEDALWDLISYFNIPPDSIVLAPSFFCGDVVHNMADHGLHTIFYSVDQNFITSPQTFAALLKKHQPQVVIIFHPVGITNLLWQHTHKWLPSLPANCLLIEDSVHRIIDPTTLKLVADRHVVIDSLRKVAPVPGANLYLQPHHKLQAPSAFQNPNYSWHVLGWWIVFQLCLTFQQLLPFWQWQKWWNNLAEKSMLKGYDVIGDSKIATAGWKWAQWLAAHLDIEKIHQTKAMQVALYQSQLVSTLQNKPTFFTIPFAASDAPLLRGFPVGLHIKSASKVLNALRKKGLLVRFELNDSPWSQKYKVVYLPLGPHLNTRQIKWVINTLIEVSTQI